MLFRSINAVEWLSMPAINSTTNITAFINKTKINTRFCCFVAASILSLEQLSHPAISISYPSLCCFEKYAYNAGITTNVNKVAEKSPPTTTVASGFCTSEHIPVASKLGIRPRAVFQAVMCTGRSTYTTPSNTD